MSYEEKVMKMFFREKIETLGCLEKECEKIIEESKSDIVREVYLTKLRTIIERKKMYEGLLIIECMKDF